MAHFGRGLRVHFGGHVYDKRLQIERALPVLTAHAVELGIPESGGLHQRLFQILGGLLADCGVVHGSLSINQFLCLFFPHELLHFFVLLGKVHKHDVHYVGTLYSCQP
uniref:Uncharacterized protein n=1 Tax=Cacopsylla melanoneura TaxID=428564 RepID=A0A8D8M582_9HEMI